MLRRRSILWGAAALLAACKRNEDPVVPEIWDDAPVPGRAEALGRLAPPWPAPARATLDNGLLTYWLHDPDASAAHVRLLMPDFDQDPLPSLAVRTVAELLQQTARRGMGRAGVSARQTRRAGRIELALSGPSQALPRMLAALARPLGRPTKADRRRTAALLQARTRVARNGEGRTALDVAMASTVASLLGTSLDSQRIDPSRAESLGADVLARTWDTVLDPRRCVLVLHTPQAPDTLPDAFVGLERWTGVGRREAPGSSLARLRWTPPSVDPQNVMVDGGAPLLLPEERVTNGSSLVFGARLPTPDLQQRAMARLAQRLLAESHDARLALSGPLGVFTVNTPVSEKSVEARARALAQGLADAGNNRAPRQRLFTAAQLWLGARVVQASLEGEDWTALWSESMDLASSEADIPRALADDAAAMLSIEPEPLAAWTREHLDPRLSKTAWAWALGGATDRMQRPLSRLTKTQPLAPTA